jgi:hypothetical protein
MKPKFWTPGQLLGFHMLCLATCPYMPNKEMVKDRERFITQPEHSVGTGKVST